MYAKRTDHTDEGATPRPAAADDAEEEIPPSWPGRHPRPPWSPRRRKLVYWVCYAVALGVLVIGAVYLGRQQRLNHFPPEPRPAADQDSTLGQIKLGTP